MPLLCGLLHRYAPSTGPGTPPEVTTDVCTAHQSGPGAGFGGHGGRSSYSFCFSCGKVVIPESWTRGGRTYGSTTYPEDFGSGGGSAYAYDAADFKSSRGGPGGGAIKLQGVDLVDIAYGSTLYSKGGSGSPRPSGVTAWGGGGSGGSILAIGRAVVGRGTVSYVSWVPVGTRAMYGMLTMRPHSCVSCVQC